MMKKAYGGVIINGAGQVLLREPANHYDDYVWTFAKGKPDPGETPEETALREVKEEIGVVAKIVTKIPGSFDASTTSNEYFLMVPVEDTGGFHWETKAGRWANSTCRGQRLPRRSESTSDRLNKNQSEPIRPQ
jgi:8-oxo-dGTP pyrophosphatase MutT (NUDIX family)